MLKRHACRQQPWHRAPSAGVIQYTHIYGGDKGMVVGSTRERSTVAQQMLVCWAKDTSSFHSH